jgi:tRNA nucleotidyltransferase/poly(A) polymerase
VADAIAPERSPAEAIIRRVIAYSGGIVAPVWMVGGYVRDQLLGRHSHDLDLIVPAGGIRLARQIADAFGGAAFVLDAERDVGRAVLKAGELTVEVDVARLRSPDLLGDLALRDFTINAIAVDLRGAQDAGAPTRRVFDPFDGRLDLGRRTVRAVGDGAFRDDPLRALRAVRFAAELGFVLDERTAAMVRRDAALLAGVSGERIRDELFRLVAAPGAWQHVRTLDALGLLEESLPESAACRGVEQSPPHYQDVLDHTRSVMAHLEGLYSILWPGESWALPEPAPGDGTALATAEKWGEVAALLAPYAEELRTHLGQPLAVGRSRRELLFWAALAHDWGKPGRRKRAADERWTFYGHDADSAAMALTRLRALKTSADEADYVSLLAGEHMRPTLMGIDYPPSRRAVYRFYRDTGTAGPDTVLLSLADHLATRAAHPDAVAWKKRAGLTKTLLDAYFVERASRVDPRRLLNGAEVMELLGVPPGPEVGRLLDGLREAQAVGEVATADEARSWLRLHYAEGGTG